MKFKYITVLFVVTLFFACKTEHKEEALVQEHIAALKAEFAPDKREIGRASCRERVLRLV